MPPPSSNDGFDDLDRNLSDFEAVQPDPGNKMKRRLLQLAGRWYWIALFAILGFLGSYYYLSKAPKEYTSTATLLINQETSVLGGRSGPNVGDPNYLNTVAARIQRFDLLQVVASRQNVRELKGLMPGEVDWIPAGLRSRLPLGPAPATSNQVPDAAFLAGNISGWLSVSVRRFTSLIDISITHPVPEVAQEIANSIAKEYLREIYEDSKKGNTGSFDLLEKQATRARAELGAANTALATYERALELHRNLDAKESDLNLLGQRYLPKHPKMIAAANEIAGYKERFIAAFDLARQDPSDAKHWEAVKKAIDLPDPAIDPDAYLQVARQQLLARVSVLENEIQSATAFFNTMIERMKDLGIMLESDSSGVNLSSIARTPGGASGPDRKKLLATGTMGGIACGLLLALFLGWLDNKFHTVAQVASETGAGILAAIAEIKPRQLAKAEQDYLKRFPDGVDPVEPPSANWHDFMLFRPGASATSYAEMFRVLRASVSLLGDETRRKVTVFTSALPGEGKSSISANFALAAASQGKKTLLIDFDLRKPSLHQLFGVERSPLQGGLTECLANLAPLHEVATPVAGQPNLHLVVSGKRAPNPGELLDTTRIKALLVLACRNYDVVVLDTAPLLSVPDTRILAPLAHNVAMVVRAEYTRKAAVTRALKVLEEDRTPLSGLVVNAYQEKRRLIGENYSYGYYGHSKGYGYGTYGTYGDDDEEGSRASKTKRRKRKQSAR
jgi:capsular exopolysaccharide synthesis family protein